MCRPATLAGFAILLVSCARTITHPVEEPPPRAIGQLNLGPITIASPDSVHVRIVGSDGTVIRTAQLFLATDRNTFRSVEPEHGFRLPPAAGTVRLRIRTLGYGQLDTTMLADRARGRKVEVQLLGAWTYAPMVIVERVPWWKFWIR